MHISTAFKWCSFLRSGGERRVFRYLAVAFSLMLVFVDVVAVTPTCPIVTGNFQGLAAGTTSAANWSLDASGVPSSAVYFAVKSNRIHAENLGGVGIWRSSVFSTAGYSSFQVATKISSEGTQNSSEYVKVYYKVNGGAETLLDERTGNFGTIDFKSVELTGNNVQLIVKLYNYNNGSSQSSKYYIEDFRVFKEAGPCAGTGITVTASANRTTLTCTNPSATLSASSSASGVTYSWTGPNGFTSTSQNPSVSTAGTYTVTGTNSSGSGTASVTITDNKTAPGVTATGGSLSCGSSSVTLTASSSTSGVTYSWTGPNSFTSTSQNPSVSATGTYTVTATNPANGCTSSQSVTVTATAAATLWEETFTLSNGTTSRTGTTAWSTQNGGASTFSVNSNEYRATGIGTTTEGVWTSGSISISGQTNVTISLGIRSSGVDMNTSGDYKDYIRIYYILNNGSEQLIRENIGNVNGHSTSNTVVTQAGLSGSTLKVVVRARATGTDEFYYFDNVKVTGSATSSLTVSTGVSGTLTCSTTSVGLTATASATGATYSWTGPNSFTSTSQNPTVSAAGTYTVTASAGGCTASSSVTVSENKAAPQVTAAGASLSCSSSATLTASSTTSGVTYSWTGPNSFTSTTQNPVVSAAGTYTVTVTNPVNGCTASQTVTVAAAGSSTVWYEDFVLTDGTTSDTGTTSWTTQNGGTNTFSVNANELRVTGTGTTSQGGIWTSGSINIAGLSNVGVSYNLRSGGVIMNNEPGEKLDFIRVYYVLNNGAEVLISEHLGSINSNSSTDTNISVSGLSGSTLKIVMKGRATATDEFYYFDDVRVTGTAASSVSVTASASGVLTCTTTQATLSATASASGATYSWTGPNSFSSTAQNPVVTTAGQYTVTATSGSCTGSASVTVSENKTAPQLTASGANLPCSSPSATLAASSTTSGATYSWTGPNGFTSTQQNPTVTAAGQYTVTVTNPTNGCTASQTVTVTSSAGGTPTAFWVEDFTAANGTTVDTGTTGWSLANPAAGTFSVQNNEFKVSFNAANEGVWLSDVVSIQGKSNVVISIDLKSGTAGSSDYLETDDYIQVYYKLNGGAETLIYGDVAGLNGVDNGTATLAVSSDALNGNTLQVVVRLRNSNSTERYYFDNVTLTGSDAPTGTVTAAVSGPLTCTTTTVQLTAAPVDGAATYSWTGPASFTATGAQVNATKAGTYTVTVNGGSGCISGATASVVVTENKTAPVVSVNTPVVLTCTVTSTTLTASTSTAGATYSWLRPDASTVSSSNLTVTAPGSYKVTVTNPVNGCFTENTTVVSQNTTKPDVTTSVSGVISCTVASVTVTAASAAQGVTYAWTGPNSFTSTAASFTTSVAGTYTVTATDPANGCTTQKTATVTGNATVPAGVTASASGSLTCSQSSVTLTGTSTTGGVTYRWTGPAGYTSNVQNPVVTAPGAYTLTVTNPASGCTATASVTVTQNNTLPVVTASVSGMLTCITTSVTLVATPTGTATLTYVWSGPGGFTSTTKNPTVATAGVYTVVALDATSGCASASSSVTVVENKTAPGVSIGAIDPLTCTRLSVTLPATSPTQGVQYSWTGPGGFTSTEQTPVTNVAGGYTVTARNPANGCTSSASATVVQNNTPPAGVTATVSGKITCNASSVTLSGSSSTAGVTYAWTGPNNYTSSERNPVVNAPGVYHLTVAAGGCTQTADVTVEQDTAGPAGVTASVASGLTCTNTTTSITGTSTTPGVIFVWVGPGGFSSSSQTATVSVAGTYTLVVLNPVTGCSAPALVTVLENKAVPANVTASVSGDLGCAATSVTLHGSSSTANATYRWTGPQGFVSNEKDPVTDIAGTYNLTVTHPESGCTATASTAVQQGGGTIPGGVTASASGPVTCANLSVTLTATATTTGLTYAWTGPNGFTASGATASASAAGTYTVTARNSGGCTATATVTVVEDKAAPNANISNTTSNTAILTCYVNPLIYTGTSTTTGATFAWTNTNGVLVSNNAVVSVTTPGTYTLTVTGPNGCTIQRNRVVTQSLTPPTVNVSVSSEINCTHATVTLSATSSGTPVTYSWTGPNGFTSTLQNPSVSVAGDYTVTVTTPGGCTVQKVVHVSENKAAPQGVSLTITGDYCRDNFLTLNGASTTSGVTYHWSSDSGFVSDDQTAVTTLNGVYTLTVTNPANGCVTTAVDEITTYCP